MNTLEAGKLLELICLAYPFAYRGMDNHHRQATVRMWQSSFAQVSYPIVEECFNNYRMTNTLPPTVADINQALTELRVNAQTALQLHRQLGNGDMEAHFRRILHAIEPNAFTLPTTKEKTVSLPPEDGAGLYVGGPRKGPLV